MSAPGAGAKSAERGGARAPRRPDEAAPDGPAGGPPPGPRRPRFVPAALPWPPPRRAVLAVLAALTVLAGGGTWAVYGSPLLRADRVSVEGNRAVATAQIERAARVPLGGALLSVDTGAVRARLLKALPRIGDAEVERSLPHTIRVKVTERTASAVLRDGAGFTEVDAAGVRFATVGRAPRGVPLVRLTPVRSASLRHFGTRRLLRAAITVAGDLPASLRGQATAIRVRSYDDITVELSGGRSVMWGSAERGAFKTGVLAALLKAEPHAGHYDISAPTAPAASGS